MNLNEYQAKGHEAATYRPEDAITYLRMNLYSKSGEVAGLVAKLIRDQCEIDFAKLNYELGDMLWHCAEIRLLQGLEMPTNLPVLRIESVLQACDDLEEYVRNVFIFMRYRPWSMSAAEIEIPKIMGIIQYFGSLYGATLESIAMDNHSKLADRAERGVIRGSGDER